MSRNLVIRIGEANLQKSPGDCPTCWQLMAEEAYDSLGQNVKMWS